MEVILLIVYYKHIQPSHLAVKTVRLTFVFMVVSWFLCIFAMEITHKKQLKEGRLYFVS